MQAVIKTIETTGNGMMLYSGPDYPDPLEKYQMLAGIGINDCLTIPFNKLSENNIDSLRKFADKHNGKWIFFHLSYDIKELTSPFLKTQDDLLSISDCKVKFPELVAFCPMAVAGVKDHKYFNEGNPLLLSELKKTFSSIKQDNTAVHERIIAGLNTSLKKDEYLDRLSLIKDHINRGDIYEITFCRNFFAETLKDFRPENIWHRLLKISPAPLSAYYRFKNFALISASPERFIRKDSDKLISQPMKGTIRRGTSKEEDELLKTKLQFDKKERAENVMIVDLVRNDLSKIALKGSVAVEELFGVYTYPQVHQMISTIVAQINKSTKITDVLRAAFPMGSMTGAPKTKAMELIEKYENNRRGLFSGTVGYIAPNGDFDMNVIIRSILCDINERVVSFHTGGAITAASNPESEFNETRLKAKALLEALNVNDINSEL